MTTTLEVIDSAVKIGLGALISGVATYWVTHAKNEHDIRKASLEEKRNLLKEIALDIENSTDLLNDFIHTANIHIDNEEEYKLKIREKNQNLIDAHKIAYRANALANLIGCQDLATSIDDFDMMLKKFHVELAYISSPIEIKYDEIGKLITEINSCQDAIKPFITKAYASLCA